MDKKITVNELVEKVNEMAKLKKEYDFSKHIKLTYMPYVQKSSLVKSIVDTTSYEEVNGIKVYRRNTKNMLFIFTMKLIEAYTDLELNIENISNDYDALMESGAMNGLMNQIPAEEMSILRGMLDMERDDLEHNAHSLISFFESKSEAIRLAMDSMAAVLEKPEIQDKIAEFVK